MQELAGKPYLLEDNDGIASEQHAKEAKFTLPELVADYLNLQGGQVCNQFIRNSPHVDMQSDTEAVNNHRHVFGDRHPPGPREFFRMHGSHSNFVDAVGMDVQMLELIDVGESEGTFEIKFELTVSWCTCAYTSLLVVLLV